MYLSKEANRALLQRMAKMSPGTTFVTTFMLLPSLLTPDERSLMEHVMKKAGESGAPFLSLFSPEEILEMAKRAGFKSAKYVSGRALYERYFAGREDGLKAGDAEAFLVATSG